MVKYNVRESSYRYPKITIKDEALFIAVRLAKAGYYGGDPDAIMKAPAITVLRVIQYEEFERDYTEAARQLNKESAS